MRKHKIGTTVVVKDDMPHFKLSQGDVGVIKDIDKEKNVYIVVLTNGRETRLQIDAVRRIACKDIPDKPILRFLNRHPEQWHNWYFNDAYNVRNAMPKYVQDIDILVCRKMAQMIRRGIVDGCGCGCRGDYVITEKGVSLIQDQQ